MYEDEIKKSPYRGILFTLIFLIGVPVGLYFFLKVILTTNAPYREYDLNKYTAQALGFGCGFLFQMCCVLCGLFKQSFKAVTKRVVNFFSNLTVSFKFAFTMYFDEIKEDGVVFWFYFYIIVFTAYFSVNGFINVISLL